MDVVTSYVGSIVVVTLTVLVIIDDDKLVLEESLTDVVLHAVVVVSCIEVFQFVCVAV